MLRQKLKLIWRVMRGRPVAFRVEVGPGEIRSKGGAGLYLLDFAIIRDLARDTHKAGAD